MQRDRKTYENHIIELENSLDAATKNTTDYQKTIKKLQMQIKELQQMVDDEVQVIILIRSSKKLRIHLKF